MHRFPISIVVCMIALLGFSRSANAAPVTFQIAGTVDAFIRGAVVEQVPLGSRFVMTMTWETDTPASSSTATSATYEGAITYLEAIAAGLTWVMSPHDGSSSLTISNGSTADRLSGAVLDGTTTSSDSSLRVWLTRWDLLFPPSTFSSTELPSSGPTPVDSGFAKLTMYSVFAGQDVTIHATITSARSVPEPGTLSIIALGICGFGIRRKSLG